MYLDEQTSTRNSHLKAGSSAGDSLRPPANRGAPVKDGKDNTSTIEHLDKEVDAGANTLKSLATENCQEVIEENTGAGQSPPDRTFSPSHRTKASPNRTKSPISPISPS
jgi:hypothetical protein